jgi:hypothetical protein
MKPLMIPENPNWEAFWKELEAAVDFRVDESVDPAKWSWNCESDHTRTRALLEKYEVDIEGSLEFFMAWGGGCDCEVWFNCDLVPKPGKIN